MVSLTVHCLDCEYTWRPRKKITRYKRQCPKCKSYKLKDAGDAADNLEKKSVEASSKNLKLMPSKVVYDIMGMLEASSPENALHRTRELIRHLLPYKYKHRVKSPEEAFDYLEKNAIYWSKKYKDDTEKLARILKEPEWIFYEAGGDISTVDYYYALQKTGYNKSFLEFLTEIVHDKFEKAGFDSPEDYLSAWNNRKR